MNKKTFTQIWRWSLVLTVIYIAVWAVIVRGGKIPGTNAVCFWVHELVLFKLNFMVSRTLDILIAPIWLTGLILWSGDSLPEKEENWTTWHWIQAFMWLGIFCSMFDAYFLGIASGIATALLTCLAVGIVGLTFLGIKAVIHWASAN